MSETKICTAKVALPELPCQAKYYAAGLCKLHYMRKWYADHPDKLQEAKAKWAKAGKKWASNNVDRKRNLRLAREYKLKPGEFEERLEAQAGLCALCDRSFDYGGRPVVDHDHCTGIVRGIIHSRCNTGLGMFDDNVLLLKKAVEYLEIIDVSAS